MQPNQQPADENLFLPPDSPRPEDKKESVFSNVLMRNLTAGVVIVAIAVIGVHVAFFSHAAQAPYISLEASTGTLTPPASLQQSTSASGTNYVQFGSAVVTTTGSMTPPAGYTASEMNFEDNFTGTTLNTANWNTFITSLSASGGPWDSNQLPAGGSSEGSANGGTLDYCMPAQISVNNGLNLTLQASSAVSGFSAVTGCVTSYNHFQFSGGYIQFKVKMPDMAHGGFPAIWFLPGPGGQGCATPKTPVTCNRNEIDLFEGGDLPGSYGTPNLSKTANIPVNDIMATHYFPTEGGGATGIGYDTGVDLSAGYHVYGLEYKPGVSLKAYFDGTLVETFTTNINTDPYEIIMNNSEVSSTESAWHTTGPETYPTVMSIAQVQAYQ